MKVVIMNRMEEQRLCKVTSKMFVVDTQWKRYPISCLDHLYTNKKKLEIVDRNISFE